MSAADIALLITNLGVFIVFVGLFIWGILSGQFHNVEEPKYRMLDPEYTRVCGEGEEGDKNA